MCCYIDTTVGFIEIWKWFVRRCLFAIFDFILFGRIGEWWWEFLPEIFWIRIKWICTKRERKMRKVEWKLLDRNPTLAIYCNYLPPSRGFTTATTKKKKQIHQDKEDEEKGEEKENKWDFSISNIRYRHNRTQNQADKMWIMRK